MMNRTITLTFLFVLLVGVQTEEDCYGICTCDGTSVHCSNRLLTSVDFTDLLPKLPVTTTVFSFTSTRLNIFPVEDFSRLTLLQELYLGSNYITIFPEDLGKTYFPSLRILDLSYNAIKYVKTESTNQASLSTLILNGNDIITVGTNFFDAFPDLKELHLNHNKLDSLPLFQSLSKLETLRLDNNDLRQLSRDTFKGLKNLKVLNVSVNDISIIENGTLKHLESDLVEISLYRNRLTTIGPGLFTEKKTFKSINFENNFIAKLQARTFNGVTVSDKVNGINLRLNELESLDISSVQGMSPGTILLQGNNLECSCDIYKLLDETNKIDVSLVGSCRVPITYKEHELNITNKYGICNACETLDNKTECQSSSFAKANPVNCTECTCIDRRYDVGSCLFTDDTIRECQCTKFLTDIKVRYDSGGVAGKSLASWAIAVLVIGLIMVFVLISLPLHMYCKRRMNGKLAKKLSLRRKSSKYDMSSDNNQALLTDEQQPGPSGLVRVEMHVSSNDDEKSSLAGDEQTSKHSERDSTDDD